MNEIYVNAIEKAVSDIRGVSGKDSLIFPIVTDFHIHTLEEECVVELCDVMDALSKKLSPDGIIALGDNLGMLGREHQAKNDEIHDSIQGLFDKIASYWDCPLYAVNGNHDGIGTDFFLPEFWNTIVGGRYDRNTAVRDGNSAYYYVDFDNIRMICLSLPCGSDLTAENPTPLWEYGKKQLQWLAAAALSTDKPVLLVTHVPFYYEYCGNRERKLQTFNGEKITMSDIAALCGWIADRPMAKAIFDSYVTHTAYDNDEYGIHLSESATSAKLIGCLSGHMHNDSLWLPNERKNRDGEENTLPCVQCVTGATNVRINSELRNSAAGGIAMDIAVITPSEHRVNMVRIGAGENRVFGWK